MSPNYKKLLHSSCLTIASLSLCAIASHSSYAGFEWTPPPEPPPVPATMQEVPPPTVEEADALEEHDAQKAGEEAAKTAASRDLPPVIDRSKETPVQEKPTLKVKVLTPPKQEMQPSPVQEAAKQEQPPVMAKPAPMPEKKAAETVMAPKHTPKNTAGTVKVDLHPMDDIKEDNMPEHASLTPVLLPSDPSKDFDDLRAEDVVKEKAANIEPSAEEIDWNHFDVIEGFGSDMPLAMALSQIAPANYAFSFGKGVNPGQTVSWEGGKPWNEVLALTLNPINIDVDIAGNKIVLSKMAGHQPAPMPVMEEPKMEAAPAQAEEPPVMLEEKAEAKPLQTIEAAKNEPAEKPAPILKVEEDAKSPAPLMIEDMPESKAKPAKIAVSKVEDAPKNEPKKVNVVSRKAILDPGKIESVQKNEVIEQTIGKTDKAEMPKKAEEKAKAAAAIEPAVTPVPEAPVIPEKAKEDISWTPASEPKVTMDAVQSKIQVWKANSGSDLKRTLEKWSKEVGIDLAWNGGDSNIKLQQNVLINGTLKNALKILFDQPSTKELKFTLIEENGVKLVVDPRS